MMRENLRDTGQILQHILGQPLVITGLSQEISLYDAAAHYNPKDPAASELKKVIETFLQYPDATEALIREMKLLSGELENNPYLS